MKFAPRLPCQRSLCILLALCATCLTATVVHAQSATRQQHPLIKPAKTNNRAKSRITAQNSTLANFSQSQEVNTFIDAMVARNGFDRSALQALLNQVRYLDKVLQLIKPAASVKNKNWQTYRSRFVEPQRIALGVAFWDQHAVALQRAEIQYGVPAEIIVAILGVETVYGRDTGHFRVLDALATLAFHYPQSANRDARMAFFRNELESTLLLARDANMDPLSLRGSYAGAIGWPQFMPSSIRAYAVDFDGNGKIDLRTSPVDAIGSVANFLQSHGWQRDAPIVFPATVDNPAHVAELLNHGMQANYNTDQIKAAGIVTEIALAPAQLFGLIDLQNGNAPTEYWLASNNYFAITQYNRSYFYAMSVVDLSRAVRIIHDHE